MSTKDIADILKAINTEGKYDAIILRASLQGYHDFKHDKIPDHPEWGECICPKVQLVDDLRKFPELESIADDVISGKYDESADADDQKAMRDNLINDNAPSAFFEMLGFKKPSYAERVKSRLNKN